MHMHSDIISYQANSYQSLVPTKHSHLEVYTVCKHDDVIRPWLAKIIQVVNSMDLVYQVLT